MLESEIRELEQTIGVKSVEISEEKSELIQQLKAYNTKYELLQRRRKYELLNLRVELNSLKGAIAGIKKKISSQPQSEGMLRSVYEINVGNRSKGLRSSRKETGSLQSLQEYLKKLHDSIQVSGKI